MPSYACRVLTLNLVQAVCCSDHMHCCPAGMQCDLEHDKCLSSEKRVPLMKKIAAVPNEGIYYSQNGIGEYSSDRATFGAGFTSSSLVQN